MFNWNTCFTFLSYLSFIGQIAVVYANNSLRIMPLGDEITQGSKNIDTSYRAGLYQTLQNLGYDNIDLVGSQSSPKSSLLSDTDHEGHDSLISDIAFYIEELLDKADPDVVLLMAGGKEIPTNKIDNAIDDLDQLITRIMTFRPNVMLFVSNLPMRKNDFQNSRVENLFNPEVPVIVKKHADQGENVYFVDIHSVINTNLLATNIYPDENGYIKIGEKWAFAIAEMIQPNGNGLPARSILRAVSGTNRKEVTLTFTRSFPNGKADVSNFKINKGVDVFGVSVDDRNVILTTSKLESGEDYKVTVYQGTPGGNEIKFAVGWRMIVLSDWHLGEKYVFDTKPDEVENDIKIIKLLKESYGGDFIMIPGDTNAGFWSTDSFHEKMNNDLGYNISKERAVLMGGQRCYNGLLSSFRKGGYWKVSVF